jgi:hypothetical protein
LFVGWLSRSTRKKLLRDAGFCVLMNFRKLCCMSSRKTTVSHAEIRKQNSQLAKKCSVRLAGGPLRKECCQRKDTHLTRETWSSFLDAEPKNVKIKLSESIPFHKNNTWSWGHTSLWPCKKRHFELQNYSCKTGARMSDDKR